MVLDRPLLLALLYRRDGRISPFTGDGHIVAAVAAATDAAATTATATTTDTHTHAPSCVTATTATMCGTAVGRHRAAHPKN